jgi:hypothetical protein
MIAGLDGAKFNANELTALIPPQIVCLVTTVAALIVVTTVLLPMPRSNEEN